MVGLLAGLIGKGKLALGGVNWVLFAYKFVAYAMLLIMIGIVAYREGKHDCQEAASTAKITILEKQAVETREIVIRELDKKEKVLLERLAKLQASSLESVKMQVELQQIREKLNDAINARPGNAVCAPTDDELRQYDEIAKRTRNKTK